MKTHHGRIAIIAGRDPLIRDDTDGGSVFLEYLIRELSLSVNTIDVFIPRGVAGGQYNADRAAQQMEHSKKNTSSTVTFNYVPVDAGLQDAIVQDEDYFLARIERSRTFAEQFKHDWFLEFDLIYILHVANAFSLVEKDLLPLERSILFPMMTSVNYEEFTKVPSSYIEKEKNTLRKMKHICSPSNDEIKKLTQRFSLDVKSLFKIHRGFNEQDFPPHAHALEEKPKKDISLLCANGIRPQKDHLFLIPLLEKLTQAGCNVTLHLTGNNGRSHNPVYNAYTELFWKTAKEKGVLGNIVTHDIVPREELAMLIKKSDIAVYPSKSETFGKSALESVASGLPTIVCDDVPAFSEFIQDGVTGIISKRDPDIFAQDILALISDTNLYEQISMNGINLRPSFTWERVLQEFHDAQVERGLPVEAEAK